MKEPKNVTDFEAGRIQGLREASKICSRIAADAKRKRRMGEHNGAWDCQMEIDAESGALADAMIAAREGV